jgi:DNA-binding NarL/FixJ family response regulator
MHCAMDSCNDGRRLQPCSNHAMNVLLVEDSERIAERLRDLLGSDPEVSIIATVRDQQSAIDTARNGAVDVMILDLQLATGTGFGVLDALGPQRPKTIVMTNYALPQYRELARRYGVEHFLDKSVDFDRLPEILDEMRRLS